jgi:O-antigen/teichoic acid export membrane protein
VTAISRAAAPHAFDANARSPAIDGAPPVAPNLARAPEVRRIHANFVETLVFKGISTPLALGLVVLQSRFLHTSGRGAFVLAVLSVTILVRLLGQLGFAVTNRMQQRSAELRRLVQAALALGLALGVAGTAAIVAWGAFTRGVGSSVAAIAAGALVPAIVWQCISGVLLGLGRVRLWNVIQTLPPVLTTAGMFVLVVWLHHGIRGAVLAWTLAHVLTASFSLVATRAIWLPFSLLRLLDLFNLALARLALTMGAVQVVNLISYRVELFVLDRYRGIARVGVYSIAVQTGEMLWLVAGAVAAAVTAPCLHEDEKEAASLIVRSALKSFAYTAIVAAGLGTVAPFLIPALLGRSFAGAARPLAFLLPGIVAYAPVTVLVVYLSVRRGKPRLSLLVSAVGMLVTLASALALIPRHGATGAAIASSLGYFAGAGLAWFFLARLARSGSNRGDSSSPRLTVQAS